MNKNKIAVRFSSVVTLFFFAVLCLAGLGATARSQSSNSPEPSAAHAQGLPASEQVIGYLRDRFGLTEDVFDVAPLHPWVFPDYYETTFSFGHAPHTRSERIFVSRDGQYAIVGQIFSLRLSGSELERISIADRPTIGSTNAPVTIIEFSDYQCPSCAKIHEFMVQQLLPKYQGKIRVVFKHFFNSANDWDVRAAVASDCVFRLKQQSWLDYRSSIFSQADSLNPENVRDTLVGLATKLDIDKAELTSCLDSKSAMAAVQKDFGEGQAANVAGTPTFFINGQVMAGFVKPETLVQAIEQAIKTASSHRADCNCDGLKRLPLH